MNGTSFMILSSPIHNMFEYVTKGRWFLPFTRQWTIILFYILLVGGISVCSNPVWRAFIIIFQAYLVGCLTELSHFRIVKCMIYLLCYLLFSVDVILSLTYGMHISPSSLSLLAETDARETVEFISLLLGMQDFWFSLLIIIGMLLLNWLAEHNRKRVTDWMQSQKNYSGIRWFFFVILIGGCCASVCYWDLITADNTTKVDEWTQKQRHPSDALTRLLVSIVDLRISNKEMMKVVELTENMQFVDSVKDDSLNIIFVIGESFIRSHSPLYGYSLQTTPNLCREKDEGRLFVFTDAVSPYNLTTNAVRNIISCNSMGKGERWMEKPPLTAVFKQNGYHVGIYDNQRTFGNDKTTFAFSLNSYLFMPRMARLCYDEIGDSTFRYDDDIVLYYEHHQKRNIVSRFVLFHLMGQHSKFSERYPVDDMRFNYFSIDSVLRDEDWMNDQKKSLIATYDNATRYNDYVLNHIISLYRNENTIVVYVSDHGEEVFDYRDSCGRKAFDEKCPNLSYQFGVPVLIWCSEKYKKQNPEVIRELTECKDRPFTTDNMCQLLFHLSHLDKPENPYYNPSVDVLSLEYVCPPRIVNDCYDYDKQ